MISLRNAQISQKVTLCKELYQIWFTITGLCRDLYSPTRAVACSQYHKISGNESSYRYTVCGFRFPKNCYDEFVSWQQHFINWMFELMHFQIAPTINHRFYFSNKNSIQFENIFPIVLSQTLTITMINDPQYNSVAQFPKTNNLIDCDRSQRAAVGITMVVKASEPFQRQQSRWLAITIDCFHYYTIQRSRITVHFTLPFVFAHPGLERSTSKSSM